MDQEDPISQFFPGEEDVDLYGVLDLDNSARLEDIKKSYRRLALQYHPDKHTASSEETRASASIKFQQIGYAYTVLSDEKRRARYDKTGRTDEGFDLQAGEDGWDAYFEDLFDRVTKGKLDEMKMEYQGSEEEIVDVKNAYLDTKGDIEQIMNLIPHTTHDDEPRIVEIITSLINEGLVPKMKIWEKSVKDEKAKLARENKAKKEAAEAEEHAKELGVWDEFYGSGKPTQKKGKGKGKRDANAGEDDEGDVTALQILILARKKKTGAIFESLAEKYSQQEPKAKGRKGKKRGREVEDEQAPDIDDDEFEKLQQRLFGDKSKASQSTERKAKTRRSK